MLLDPNTLSKPNTLNGFVPSGDGNLLAYVLAEETSDWSIIKIRNVETGADFNETLERVKHVYISWTTDNNGFFYSV